MPFSHPLYTAGTFELTLDDVVWEWSRQRTPFPISDAPPPITPEFPDGEPQALCVVPYPTTGQAWPLLVNTPTPANPYPPEPEPPQGGTP